MRSTEGYMGISEFRGFFLERSETLLLPDPPKPRCLEFIGDSITAGAKNDGPPDAPYDDIETVRQLNPQTPIIAIEPVPAWLPSEACSWTKAAVMECKALGDNNLFFIPLNEEKPLLEAQDYAGDNTHPLKNGSKNLPFI